MMRSCFLKCLQNSHQPIALPHNTEVFIGRSALTKIKDQFCSRRQVSLNADCENCSVQLKQLGPNQSGLDGFSIIKDNIYSICHGAHVEVLLGKYVHVVCFDPSPTVTNEVATNLEGNTSKDKTSPGPNSNSRRRKRQLADTDSEDEINESSKIKLELNDTMDSQLEIEDNVKPSSECTWESIDNGELYIFTSMGVMSRSKIAAFDMDGTLIKTKSGKVHAVSTDDWQIAFPEVPGKLKECLSNKFKIVILTNQAPIGKGRVKIEDFKKKMEAIIKRIGVPVQAFIATGRGFYRKPTTGMWDALVEMKNDNVKINMKESFYCGDAAGRVVNWAPGKKKDHSLADRLLAENLGLKFYTPESYFHSLPDRAKWTKPEFNPKDISEEIDVESLMSSDKEIVILVGFPGSGKSVIAKRIEQKSNGKYKIVCRDILGSWQKCASEAVKFLEAGKSVIVDSTNPDVESRSRWVELAKRKGVKSRCLKMKTTFAHARHNNKFRELTDTSHAQVNDIIFHSYKNKYKEPSLVEGFTEILEIPFSPYFEDDQLKKLYNMHLLEK